MAKYTPAIEYKPIGLIIEPLDTLFFRDGRPFESGDSATSNWPSPQTLAGMLKSHLMNCAGIKGAQLHGERQNENAHWICQVAFAGPFPARMDKEGQISPYFAAPSILVRRGKNNKDPLDLLVPHEGHLPGWKGEKLNGYENPTLPLLPSKRGNAPVKPVHELLTAEGMKMILSGKIPHQQDLIDPTKLFDDEPRIGIAVAGDTQTAEEGMIYSARHLRPVCNTFFYAECGYESNTNGEDLRQFFAGGVVLPFGGEGRRVFVRLAEKRFDLGALSPEIAPPANGEKTRYYTTLITAMPAHSGNGRPRWWAPECATPVAACVPDPQPISGWDLSARAKNVDHNNAAGGRPKPTRYALRAGTTWFWQKGRNGNGVPPKLTQHSENPLERVAGWGLALRGKWPRPES